MIAVTGGAGFIGSHLAERLVEDNLVVVVDNFSSGKRRNLPGPARIEKRDVTDPGLGDVFEEVETVFHFAANPKVNTFPDDRDKDFHENLEGTKNVLDACVEAGVKELVFASSSVVYGEEADIPTPEEHPLDPISMYGATKAGAEHMCQVYSRIFGIDLTVLRLANIIGGRNRKGVIYDFVQKLERNPEELEILGNGEQRKSYLHVEDTVDAVITAWRSGGAFYNIGSRDAASVDQIADIVSEEMGLDPDYSYTGGEKGWEGDIPTMLLDISKLESEGWKPEMNSEESVGKTVRELLEAM